MVGELLKGLASFRRYQYSADNPAMPKLVAEGQSPRFFIISCIDSRSNPGTILRAPPGTFFEHKAMGAIVRPYSKETALSAALQFALHYNKVDTIIIMGHTQCGAIQALADNIDDEAISSFISVASGALQTAKNCCEGHDEILARTEQEVVLQSVKNIRDYPSVKSALVEGRVKIKPWLFDMQGGDLLEYNPKSEQFEIISGSSEYDDCRQD